MNQAIKASAKVAIKHPWKANFEQHEDLLSFYGGRSRIKTLGKMKSSDQGNILAIKLFDPGRERINWRYGSDYIHICSR